MSTKTIWLVMADRGDYDDRSVYPVCWFAAEAEAIAAAAKMEAASEEWRSKVRRARVGEERDRLRTEAEAAIGDQGWADWRATSYAAQALEQGQPVSTPEVLPPTSD